MKKYILPFFLILTACSLDEQPYGFLSSKNAYLKESDAYSALVYAYSCLPEIEYYSRNWFVITELPTENLTVKPDGGASNFELDELRTTSKNAELTTAWRYCYIGINRANAVIANVPKINMDVSTKNEIVGEGYFLRALHYFNLVRLFGKVPVHTEPIADLSMVSAKPYEIKDIYDIIINDLKTAISIMDNINRIGRANKIAAQALLAKVYLHLASSKFYSSPGYEFVNSDVAYYDSARIYSSYVIFDQQVYSFDSYLTHIFDLRAQKANMGLPEHIFMVATDATGEVEGNYSKLSMMFIPTMSSGTFMLPDGRVIMGGWNHFMMEPAIYNSFLPGDYRKDSLIASYVYLPDAAGNYTVKTELKIDEYQRPFSIKYIDPDRTGERTSSNTMVLRFSDILLVYAEACGPTSDGYDAINKIRNRAGLSNLTPGLSIKAFRDSVIQERAWELCFEGERLFDLRRSNKMKEVLVNKYGKVIRSGEFFFSIPQDEINTNYEVSNN